MQCARYAEKANKKYAFLMSSANTAIGGKCRSTLFQENVVFFKVKVLKHQEKRLKHRLPLRYSLLQDPILYFGLHSILPMILEIYRYL